MAERPLAQLLQRELLGETGLQEHLDCMVKEIASDGDEFGQDGGSSCGVILNSKVQKLNVGVWHRSLLQNRMSQNVSGFPRDAHERRGIGGVVPAFGRIGMVNGELFPVARVLA